MATFTRVGPPPLVELAKKSVFALSDTDRWLHRRVDRVSFTPQLMVSRQVSVDFTIPPGLPPFREGSDGVNEYFVPIALLRKWPPPMQFDLRSPENEPISLLTSRKSREIDAAALLALAPPGPLKVLLEDRLCDVVRADAVAAQTHLETIGNAIGNGFRSGALDATERSAWVPALKLATSLAANTLIWARVTGDAHSRHIVKFSQEYPAARNFYLHSRVLAALSWQPIRIQLELATLGERGSQHLEVDLPPELQAQRVQFRVLPFPPQEPEPTEKGQVERALHALGSGARALASAPLEAAAVVVHALWRKGLALAGLPRNPTGDKVPKHAVRPRRGEPYAWNTNDRAYFYMAGGDYQYGLVTMHVAVANRTIINGALAMAAGTAALLTVFLYFRDQIVHLDHIEPAVTTLLLVPVILGALVARPGEHPMVRRHLAGVRGLLIVAGALPVVAAVVLVTLGPKPSGDDLYGWWLGLTIAAWAVAVLVALSWLLPPARRERFVRPDEARPKLVEGGGLEVED